MIDWTFSMANGRFPNLIIAGVNKGGTTSLFSYLTSHPEVCGSIVKETCFFLPTRYGEKQPSVEEYRRFFSHCRNQKYVIESTPGYFYGGNRVAEIICRELGLIKILVVLRDPVDRLFSFYRFMKSMLKLDPLIDLDDYVRRCNELPIPDKRKRENNLYWGVEGGKYAEYLAAWLEIFGDNLRVIFFDDLKADPVATMQEICRWLEIDPLVFNNAHLLGVENRTKNFRLATFHRVALALNKGGERFLRAHPWLKNCLRSLYARLNEGDAQERLAPEARIRLQALYTESNAQLVELLTLHGYHQLPAWLKSTAGGV